jgi:hypothetical protein
MRWVYWAHRSWHTSAIACTHGRCCCAESCCSPQSSLDSRQTARFPDAPGSALRSVPSNVAPSSLQWWTVLRHQLPFSGPETDVGTTGLLRTMATHVELAGLDHCWTRHASIEKSRGNCGRGEETSAMSDAVLPFLR